MERDENARITDEEIVNRIRSYSERDSKAGQNGSRLEQTSIITPDSDQVLLIISP